MYVDSANRTRMYVNGVSQTNTSRTDISGWTTPIVGALNTSGDNSLNGSLTQMLVYSVALSASQVAERYNLGHGTDNLPTGITTQCVMRFKFSEGTGDTVDNSATAGAGYDMTLADTPTWVNGILGSSGSPGVMLPAWQYGKLQSTTFNVPIPHGWNPSNTLHPHIHIIPESDLSNGQTIVFEMEWTFANIGEAYGNTAVVEATYVSDGVTYNGTHILVEFPDWHPTLTTVSAEYIVRINRGTDTYTGDVFVLNFGVHGEIKQVGSRQLYIF
jgi:hypothetical protein